MPPSPISDLHSRFLPNPLIAMVLTLLLAGVTCGRTWAQSAADPHAVQPERPTVATHAGTVAAAWFEIESGGEVDGLHAGGSSLSVPTVLKLGLAPRMQLNVSVPATSPIGGSLGIGDFAVGVKWRLLEDAPVVHDFAILPSIKLPTGSESAFRGTGTTDFSILLISSRIIGPVAIDLNAGYTVRSGNGTVAPKHATIWTASFGFPLKGRLGAVTEFYGYPGTSGPAGAAGTAAVLAGPTFLVHPWLALDAGTILPISGPQPYAVYAGAVWNLGRIW